MTLEDRLDSAIGRRPRSLTPLSGGCVGDVQVAEFEDGERLVAKWSDRGGLAVEGRMLLDLAGHGLPVPAVAHCDDELLVMEWIDSDGTLDASAQEHAAELLADLHDITAEDFGYDYDTVIGGLPQINRRESDWVTFFGEHRLAAMAAEGERVGRLPPSLRRRVDHLVEALDRFLGSDSTPGLIHGDVWGGNVLCRGGRIAAFIDPAIHFADPEVELAFATLFGTFGDPFFRVYSERRPLRDGFFPERRDLYNLYPLLVHTRLFGGSYVGSVEATLGRFGF